MKKKMKKKRKWNPECGRWGERWKRRWKQNKKWSGKQIENRMEQGWTKKDGKNTDRKMRKEFGKRFLNQAKRKLMATNY